MRERSRRIRTDGNQAFNVLCNDEGRTFLRLMRKFLNRPRWRYSARGRGPRALDGRSSYYHQSSLPQDKSEWLAVYLGGTSGWGRFNAILNPSRHQTVYQYAVKPAPAPAHVLTGEERALVQKIFEEVEDDMTFVEPEVQDLFYSAFEKLVDI